MPRFTPWRSGVPLDPSQSSEVVVDEVLRPSLRRAFPLPAPEQGEEQHFRFLLDSITYVNQGKQ